MMIKNILITGANGQLGNEMQKVLKSNSLLNPFYTDVEQLDISKIDELNCFVKSNNIDCIINCAAYTAVDAAEDNETLCYLINSKAVENIANVAKNNNCKVIHISTDYVFDGTNCNPYKENDKTNPQSIYGKSKVDGEETLIREIPNDSIIIRTAWLYSSHGKNFVKTMIDLGKNKNSLNVVSDQIGSPTYAGDLAKVIYEIIVTKNWHSGIYHFTNEGVCSWYDFAKAIHKFANISSCIVNPISTAEYPTKAKRPAYSVLDKSKIKNTYNIRIPYWMDSLKKCIAEL